MKIGYPCINRSIGCTANSTFRLKNYSEARLIATVDNNLACLQRILDFNLAHELDFFRISSDIIPFASHPVCTFAWPTYFKEKLVALGNYIKQHTMRISMHPDQFVLINAPRPEIVEKSFKDLAWHCELLDAMQLDSSAKVQIHVGGMYGDKAEAIKNFIQNYQQLPDSIKQRLVIENDDRLFTLADCLRIYQKVGIPIIFDNLHHDCNNEGDDLFTALTLAAQTWQTKDGIPMVDYSSQAPDARRGKHIESIDTEHFGQYLTATRPLDFDIMLEIKDKEPSAIKAMALAKQLKII
jgi:UV DNA damage endonuclease